MNVASLRSPPPVRPAAATSEPVGSRELFAELLSDISEAAPGHDRDGTFPFENFDRLHQDGLLGLTVRGADGGGNAGLVEVAEIVGAIGHACPSTALVLAMQAIHQKAIARSDRWPEHLRVRVGRSASGCGALINALRVEPSLGTPARGVLPETCARRTAEGWSISGRKIYSTGAPGLTWMLVSARTDEAASRAGTFLVRARSEGVRVEETWNHLGLRASGSHDVIFDDVVVPEDHAVDLRPPDGWRQPDPMQASWNAATIGSLYTGVARGARDWLVKFLNGRVPGNVGASLATLPRMQEAVGAIEALLAANIRRHHTDGGGDTDHVFGLCALLGVQYAPRIPDLKHRRLFIFGKPSDYETLKKLIGGRINVALIRAHWSEILRIIASIRTGTVAPSVIMRQLASYQRQNGVSAALRELGKLERTLFTLDWIEDPELRRETGQELNKGQSRNSLARAVLIHRLGEIRDRTYENQRHRVSGLNLIVTAIILWNTRYLERAVAILRQTEDILDNQLAHLSPLGWEHINLTGDYIWLVANGTSENTDGLRALRGPPLAFRKAA